MCYRTLLTIYILPSHILGSLYFLLPLMTKLVSVYQTMLSSIRAIFYNVIVVAHLPFYSTMSFYDYVYLLSKALSFLWLCFTHIDISSFSLFYFIISSNILKLFVFNNQWKTPFSNKGEPFYFLFCSLCVPLLNHHCTHMSTTSLFVCRFICHLFERVALLPLSVPLCFEPCLCPPSLCFVQRAAAFHCTTVFVDPHVYIYTFPSSFVAFQALESFI